jgi:hypothetical protein
MGKRSRAFGRRKNLVAQSFGRPPTIAGDECDGLG